MFNISFHFGMEYVCMLFFLLILILVLCIANFENTKIFWLPSTPRVFTSPFVLYVSNPERYLLLVQLRASKWSGDRRNSEISLTGAKIPRSFIFKIDILFVCFSGLFFMGRFLYIIFFVCVCDVVGNLYSFPFYCLFSGICLWVLGTIPRWFFSFVWGFYTVSHTDVRNTSTSLKLNSLYVFIFADFIAGLFFRFVSIMLIYSEIRFSGHQICDNI
jgi:hypothetical protein